MPRTGIELTTARLHNFITVKVALNQLLLLLLLLLLLCERFTHSSPRHCISVALCRCRSIWSSTAFTSVCMLYRSLGQSLISCWKPWKRDRNGGRENYRTMSSFKKFPRSTNVVFSRTGWGSVGYNARIKILLILSLLFLVLLLWLLWLLFIITVKQSSEAHFAIVCQQISTTPTSYCTKTITGKLWTCSIKAEALPIAIEGLLKRSLCGHKDHCATPYRMVRLQIFVEDHLVDGGREAGVGAGKKRRDRLQHINPVTTPPMPRRDLISTT